MGSWVSSLIKIELALEILHTRSKTAQDGQLELTQRLKEETIEVTFESKSIQLKTKKNSSTGWTDPSQRIDALSVYLLWMKAGIKSKTL